MNIKIGVTLIIISIIILGGAVMLLSSKDTVTTKTPPIVKPTSSLPLESAVTLTATGFTPKEIRVKAGNAIRFRSEVETASINSDDHPSHNKFPEINLGEIRKGESLMHVLIKPGIYTYHNHNNPTQKGVIIVE